MLINQVMHIISFCLGLFCVTVVLLWCCFRALKMNNHHLLLINGSTMSKQSSRWSSGHPKSLVAAV